MISLQNETIQAVLFHERTGEAASEALKAFLQRILQRFGEVFKQELEQLQPQLQASATPMPEKVGVDTGTTTWTLSCVSTFCIVFVAFLYAPYSSKPLSSVSEIRC